MNYERSILVSFLGNYLTNNVIAAIVALMPFAATAAVVSPQYIVYVLLAAVLVAVLTWWVGARGLKAGAIFGVIGFLVALATAFVTGITGVLTQTGSLAEAGAVIPKFWPFLASWSTLVLLGYWVVPAALMGWVMDRKQPTPMM
jgi:hypothetical protein